MIKNLRGNPWLWIPTLYFAEGIPYFIVNNISVVMFTKMGMSNGNMALITSLLYLPWALKPLWSPVVDIFRTKRFWIVAMQALMACLFVLSALSLPSPGDMQMASRSVPVSSFIFTLILFELTAFASATHDIAADGFYMIGLDRGSQSFFVGIRSTFYRLSSIFGQGVIVVIAGVLESRTGDIPTAWRLTIAFTAVLFAAVTLWHTFMLPKPEQDKAVSGESPYMEFLSAFVSFFKKPGVIAAVAFMLLYRLPEELLLKMVQPFLLSSTAEGGLALSTATVGIVYGTIGVVALIIGGIAGGMWASRKGLGKSLWPMAAMLALPCAVFVYMAYSHADNLWIISTFIAIEQFGYGFGFTAYMLFMMYFSEGSFKTSHYAICTAFMALSMMLPGMVAGYIQEQIGYPKFFLVVMLCCLATFVAVRLVRVPEDYGRKNKID